MHWLLLVLSAGALLAHCAGAPLTSVPVLSSGGSGALVVNLTVVAARLSSGSDFTFSTRAYQYWSPGGASGGPGLFGPTLRVRPGDVLTINLINALEPDAGVQAAWPMNAVRQLNTTNMHTHGLHISPQADDVFSYVRGGGGSRSYVYAIPPDHAPGIHWYHSHWHGATMLHVMGGLLGALIVDPPAPSPLPAWLSAMTEYVLLMQTFIFEQATNVTHPPAPPRSSDLLSFAAVEAWAYNGSGGGPGGGGYTASAVHARPMYFTINGLVAPSLSLAAGSWSVFRIVYGAANALPTIALTGGVYGSCSMYVVAMDGVYLTAPRAHAFVRLSPGVRADVAIGCAAPGAVNLSTTANQYSLLEETLLALTITGAQAAALAPLPAAIDVPRPSYLADMMHVEAASSFHVSTAQPDDTQYTAQTYLMWLGLGPDCSGGANQRDVAQGNPNCSYGPFMHGMGEHAGHSAPSTVVVANQPAQIRLFGTNTVPHPMHMHVNHFQVVSPPQGDAGDGWSFVGDWRDTLIVGGVGVDDLANDTGTLVRFWPFNYTGEVVIHCHILHHEDTGMMTTFLIANATTPAALAAGAAGSNGLALALGLGLGLFLPAVFILVASYIFCPCLKHLRKPPITKPVSAVAGPTIGSSIAVF